ncbi:MAG: hypothetical protein QXF15_01490 [Candidatus Aenigmatarchaeota archaeon]|nr:hypothetical protein [Candidatus Aenigmarchaeota archaeon]
MTEIITYEYIRMINREEKKEDEKGTLSKLPNDFYKSVSLWFNQKQNSKNPESIIEVKNAKLLLEDIINRRMKKIVLGALRTIRGELPLKNMTEEEQKFFDELILLMKNYKDQIRGRIFDYTTIVEEKISEAKNKILEIKEEKRLENNCEVLIIQDIPRFLGPDEKEYGPYSCNERINLPIEIAEMLSKRNLAKILNTGD